MNASPLKPTEHPTRTWCTYDGAREELTVVRDGAGGIAVVTIPLDAVVAAIQPAIA